LDVKLEINNSHVDSSIAAQFLTNANGLLEQLNDILAMV